MIFHGRLVAFLYCLAGCFSLHVWADMFTLSMSWWRVTFLFVLGICCVKFWTIFLFISFGGVRFRSLFCFWVWYVFSCGFFPFSLFVWYDRRLIGWSFLLCDYDVGRCAARLRFSRNHKKSMYHFLSFVASLCGLNGFACTLSDYHCWVAPHSWELWKVWCRILPSNDKPGYFSGACTLANIPKHSTNNNLRYCYLSSCKFVALAFLFRFCGVPEELASHFFLLACEVTLTRTNSNFDSTCRYVSSVSPLPIKSC